MRYCKYCDKNVSPKKKSISWLAVILFGIIYAPYRLCLVYRTRCPVCGLTTKWKKK